MTHSQVIPPSVQELGNATGFDLELEDKGNSGHAALITAIKTKLLPLGDDMSFLCGHGPGSTIGAEKAGNPFLR